MAGRVHDQLLACGIDPLPKHRPRKRESGWSYRGTTISAHTRSEAVAQFKRLFGEVMHREIELLPPCPERPE